MLRSRSSTAHPAGAISTRPDLRTGKPRIPAPARASYTQTVTNFDYSAPAELFAAHGRRGLRYRRFSKAAEAIRYAVEKQPGEALPATSIEVENERYDSGQIRA